MFLYYGKALNVLAFDIPDDRAFQRLGNDELQRLQRIKFPSQYQFEESKKTRKAQYYFENLSE